MVASSRVQSREATMCVVDGRGQAVIRRFSGDFGHLPLFTADCCPGEGRLQSGFPAADNLMGEDRLDSWKEIAAYLRRDVTTVQRWEKREKMPVHRHLHDKLGSVYAYRSELDAWTSSRKLAQAPPREGKETPEPDPARSR